MKSDLQMKRRGKATVDIDGMLFVSDLGLFSTKTLVEANPDHQVEVRTQVINQVLFSFFLFFF